jgi:hypothetical protein
MLKEPWNTTIASTMSIIIENKNKKTISYFIHDSKITHNYTNCIDKIQQKTAIYKKHSIAPLQFLWYILFHFNHCILKYFYLAYL